MVVKMRSIVLASLIAWSVNVTAQNTVNTILTEFMASNQATLADGDDDFSDWIEIYNPTTIPISLAGCFLSDDADNLTKWQFPESVNSTVPAKGYLVIFASGKADNESPYIDSLGYIHTSFKLSADGESVILTDRDGLTVISGIYDYPNQGPDISYGRGTDNRLGYFRTPTPGAANGEAGEGWVDDTHFSIRRGFYTDPFNVEITTDTPEATIRYTLDGSTPSETIGTIYTGPIEISKTTVLRAMAYKNGWFSTNVDTQTYLFLATIVSQSSAKPGIDWPTPTTTSSSGGGGGGWPGLPGWGGSQVIDYEMDPQVTGDSRYADSLDEALLAIPSISIVTDLKNLFDSRTGIYMNSLNEGIDWERPVSVELIHPDGTEGFQVDTGLRIRGGVSAFKSNPKHSFRIIMRSEYGDSKIEYPLFGADGPDTFDKLDFRTAQNFSWNFSSAQYATWLDDPFSRDTMRDMGHPFTNGFFFHLYLNGVYWGLYQTEERPDAMFGETYLGGERDDYDVVKSDEDTGVMYATDGTIDFYSNFWTQVNAGVSSNSSYFRIQGMNEDGTANSTYPRYLDVDNLIDYMLIVFFTGAQDMPLGPPNSNTMPRNLYAIANRVNPDGFKYLPHDNEWSLSRQSGLSVNRVSVSLNTALARQNFFNPWWLHVKLKGNQEYLLHFADRVHKHFFNNGALTPQACTERYQKRIDEIATAIIAESARWGDTLSTNDPRTKDDDWLPAVTWVRDSFFNATPKTRTDIVLTQLKTARLYPSVAAPEFDRFGGEVDYGANLTISAPTGSIYYTTDGSDPRQIGGTPGITALSGNNTLSVSLYESSTVKARAYDNGVWSALTEADFTVTGEPQNIKSWFLH